MFIYVIWSLEFCGTMRDDFWMSDACHSVCCLWSLRQKELSDITCWKGIILLSTVISARKILKHKITKLVLFKSLENTQVQNKTFCKVYSSIVACCNAAIPTLYAINNHYAIPECNAENCVNKIISRKNLVKLSL